MDYDLLKKTVMEISYCGWGSEFIENANKFHAWNSISDYYHEYIEDDYDEEEDVDLDFVMYKLIDDSFAWRRSPQGENFWSDIHDSY